MPDKNDKFEMTEDLNEDEFKDDNEIGKQSIVYSFLILMTGVGFTIGAILSAVLVGGIICVFDSMVVFTSELGAMGGDQEITEMAKSVYIGCLYRSAFSPLTIISGFIGGFLLGYPSYKTAKNIMDGQKLKTIL